MAGFLHVALVEYEKEYCEVLSRNRPDWPVICQDVHHFDGTEYKGIDLFAGGVPCPPFSVAGKQLGQADDRDLFPEAIRLIKEISPRAIMLENVRGFMNPIFTGYREQILSSIEELGYDVQIKLVNAADYGVPQSRPRAIIVGIRKMEKCRFTYPQPYPNQPPSVGSTIADLMRANGWYGVDAWIKKADGIAPTIVGGSKKHGGPDLGPTRARSAWAELGVDGIGVADQAPAGDFQGMPRLTPRMIARIQGFPDAWEFGQKKTAACRMIGNAFPPPVAQAIGLEIRRCLQHHD